MTAGSPTLRLIASRCGCSRNTVSLALRKDPRVTPDRAKRILEVAATLGYRPDPKVAQIMSHIAQRDKVNHNKMAVVVGADFDRPDPWKNGSWLERFYLSMSRRMNEYGYTFDCFWLGQPKMSPVRVRQIINHRGIEGLIVFSYARAPAVIDFDFSGFAASVIGRGLAHPRLHAVGGNLHNDLDLAFRKVSGLGYRRIGLALPSTAAARSLHCWEAAYQFQQFNLQPKVRVSACIFDASNLRDLHKWLVSQEPDCVIGVSETYRAVQKLGFRVPQQFGFATLEQENHMMQIAGINLPHGLIASKAVDIVVENLRANRRGLPANPELILYDGTWIDGDSLPGR